ncbi:MAG: hypothetical protein JXA24_05455 [Proteobacteria bacterium]|nr:hypothetical protein [Pseudomonadota bacterium]
MQPADGITGFTLNVEAAIANDIYITGLKLAKADALLSSDPLLAINHYGAGTIHLKDTQLSNVKNGLKMTGLGKIELGAYDDKGVVVTGDSTKSGSCIDVKSKNAVLSGVQASGCHEGVKIDAVGVEVKGGSIIRSNHLGVHVMSENNRPVIQGSSIYNNKDPAGTDLLRNYGVKIEGSVMHELVFYKMEENEPVPLLDGEDIIEYKDSPAYVLIDVPEGNSGKVEFFLSMDDEASATCSGLTAYKQSCSSVGGMTNPVTISSGMLDLGPVEITLSPQVLNKTLIAMYNDSEKGSAGISRQFSFSASPTGGGVVAFVANPYDIPTTGGATDVPVGDDEEEGGGSSMGGDGVTTEGGGGIIGAAGAASGCGGGASLMGLAWHDASAGGIAWCILIALSAIGAMRLVHAPIKRRRR